MNNESREKLSSAPSPAPKCGKPAESMIPRWGMSWACVLEPGHEGDCRGGGNCFKHGEYVGPQCPQWPDCAKPPFTAQQIESMKAAPSPAEETASEKLRLAYALLDNYPEDQLVDMGKAKVLIGEVIATADKCEGGESCWHNPQTGYLEACPKHEAIAMDRMMEIEASRHAVPEPVSPEETADDRLEKFIKGKLDEMYPAHPKSQPMHRSLRQKVDVNLKSTGDWRGRSPAEVSAHHELAELDEQVVPEPVSPEGNVIHVPRIPGTVNTPVGPIIPAPEVAASLIQIQDKFGERLLLRHSNGDVTTVRIENGLYRDSCPKCGTSWVTREPVKECPTCVAAPIAPAADGLIQELDVHRDATESEKAEARSFMRDCDKLIPYRSGLLAMIEKMRVEILIRERQLTRAEEYRKGAKNG